MVRNLCGVAGVVAVAWPNSNNADGIELLPRGGEVRCGAAHETTENKTPLLYVAAKNKELP